MFSDGHYKLLQGLQAPAFVGVFFQRALQIRSNSNKKKDEQLGMNAGTAYHRLRKSLLFSLVKECGRDWCYQCGERIENEKDLSVEHMVPWLDSEDPVKLFFDLDNISFSHLKCNISNARKPNKKYETERESKDARNKRRNATRKAFREANPELVKQKRRERYLRTGN